MWKRLVVLAVAAALIGGCGVFGSVEKKKISERQETVRTALEAELPQPLVEGGIVTETGDVTVTVAPKAPLAKSKKKLGATTDEETESWLQRRSHLQWALFGGGLILCVVAFKYAWKAIKHSSAGKLLKAGDDAGKRLVASIKEKMTAETNPEKLNGYKDAVIATEAERDKVWEEGEKNTV